VHGPVDLGSLSIGGPRWTGLLGSGARTGRFRADGVTEAATATAQAVWTGSTSSQTASQPSAEPGVGTSRPLGARPAGPVPRPWAATQSTTAPRRAAPLGIPVLGPLLGRVVDVLDRVAPAQARRRARARGAVEGTTSSAAAGLATLSGWQARGPSPAGPAVPVLRASGVVDQLIAARAAVGLAPEGSPRAPLTLAAAAPRGAEVGAGTRAAQMTPAAALATELRARLRGLTGGGQHAGPGVAGSAGGPAHTAGQTSGTVRAVSSEVLSSLGPRPVGPRAAMTAPVPSPAAERVSSSAGLWSAAGPASTPLVGDRNAVGTPQRRTGDRAAVEPLTRPPRRGPVVSGPNATAELRVLGTGTVAGPGGESFDPAGAVSVQRRPPSPVEAMRSPEERWTAAVAARPLSPAVPLPSAFRALARAVTGRESSFDYTTGPATRAALRAAGARGATTGRVVHLPEAPTVSRASMGLLAHELAHTRSPVVRPRFLLAGHDHVPDSDERDALDAGARAAQGGTHSAGLVDDLPVGAGAGGVAEMARRAVRAALAGAAAGPAAGRTIGPAASWPTGGAAEDVLPEASSDGPPPGAAAAPARAAAAAPAAAAPASGPVGGAPAPADLPDMDRLVEALEQRLLVELERRGGRWAGVF
jgi:hypothetical protein